MKIAVSGKGRIGEVFLTSLLFGAFAESGYSILAVEAASNDNLTFASGFPHLEGITPLSEVADHIEEGIGARLAQVASYFELNPEIDGLSEKHSLEYSESKISNVPSFEFLGFVPHG